MSAMVFLVAIATQWTGFQLNFVADARYGGDADALTRFFGTFNFLLGSASFVVQLFATSRALRRFGLAVTILTLPLALGLGTSLIVLLPAFWPVLVTNAFDQGLRFSVDKPTYELLYLPIRAGAAPARSRTRSTSWATAWLMRSAPCSSAWPPAASSCCRASASASAARPSQRAC